MLCDTRAVANCNWESSSEALEYGRRIQVVYTPKHGSWLNVAECELSCLTWHCLSARRIADLATLQAEIAACASRTNANQRAIDWQFTIEKARIKLKRLYPKIQAGRCTNSYPRIDGEPLVDESPRSAGQI